MSTPQSIEHFRVQVLQNQRTICSTLQEPLINTRALLTLSRPVSSVLLGDNEVLVMEYFQTYWLFDPVFGLTGYFGSEDDAVRYVQSQMMT